MGKEDWMIGQSLPSVTFGTGHQDKESQKWQNSGWLKR